MLLRKNVDLDLACIFDAIEEPVVIISRDFHLVGANATARRRYGWSDTGRPHHCYWLTHAADSPCFEHGEECPVRTVFATGQSSRVVHLHTTADGQRSIEEVIASPLYTPAGELHHVVEEIRDLNQHAEAVIERLNRELKTLRGILPMCASCKRIRDADGSWVAVDEYISANSEANFSHGLCPACVAALYPNHRPKR